MNTEDKNRIDSREPDKREKGGLTDEMLIAEEYRRETNCAEADGAEASEGLADVPQNDKIGTSDDENGDKSPLSGWSRFVVLLKKFCKRYFIDAFTGMAQGLFCTLIAGTILGQIGSWIQAAGTDAGLAVGGAVVAVANIAKMLMGAGIGIGIAHALKAPKLVMFTAAVAGLVGA